MRKVLQNKDVEIIATDVNGVKVAEISSDEILIGETYTFYGSLGWSVEPSYIGYENGRWLLSDIVLVD